MIIVQNQCLLDIGDFLRMSNNMRNVQYISHDGYDGIEQNQRADHMHHVDQDERQKLDSQRDRRAELMKINFSGQIYLERKVHIELNIEVTDKKLIGFEFRLGKLNVSEGEGEVLDLGQEFLISLP